METILITFVLPLGAMFAVMYFLMIKPQKKQESNRNEMVNNLVKGDRIRTIGGVVGTVTSVNDDTILIRTGNSDVEFVKDAIAAKRELTNEN